MERLLSQLAPAQLDSAVKNRVARQLEAEQADRRRRAFAIRLSVAMAGVAACLAVALAVFGPSSVRREEVAGVEALVEGSAVAPPFGEALLDGYRPVRRFNELLQVDESPVFYVDGGLPAKEIYLRYLDTVIMESEDGSASFRLAAPREVVRVIPVMAD